MIAPPELVAFHVGIVVQHLDAVMGSRDSNSSDHPRTPACEPGSRTATTESSLQHSGR